MKFLIASCRSHETRHRRSICDICLVKNGLEMLSNNFNLKFSASCLRATRLNRPPCTVYVYNFISVPPVSTSVVFSNIKAGRLLPRCVLDKFSCIFFGNTSELQSIQNYLMAFNMYTIKFYNTEWVGTS